MEFELLRILLLVCSSIISGVLIFATIKYSDQEKNYRFMTLGIFIPFTIFEFLHLFVPDPLKIFDIFTHLFGGLIIFLVFSNLIHIKKEYRNKLCLFITFLFISLLELFLSLIHYQAVNYDILVDIIVVLIGGIIGYLLFLLYNRN
ncbi:MAG: hypothetical protein ACP6IY_20075 [Promethearchaeia archaeon]